MNEELKIQHALDGIDDADDRHRKWRNMFRATTCLTVVALTVFVVMIVCDALNILGSNLASGIGVTMMFVGIIGVSVSVGLYPLMVEARQDAKLARRKHRDMLLTS